MKPYIVRCNARQNTNQEFSRIRVVIKAPTMDAAIDEFRKGYETHPRTPALVCDDPEQTGEKL